MNIKELKAKALAEFDVWPFRQSTMVYSMVLNVFDQYGKGHGEDLQSEWLFIYTREEFEADKAKQSKVYWNGTEELKVGMWVTRCNEKVEVLLPAGRDGNYIFDSNRHGYLSVEIDELNPVDNRTDKEKAIDLVVEDLSVVDESTRKTLEVAYDKWEVSL